LVTPESPKKKIRLEEVKKESEPAGPVMELVNEEEFA